MTLEDETGIANAIVWPKVFETFRPVVLGARLVSITGTLQNEAGVIHVVAERVEDLSPLLLRLAQDPGKLDTVNPGDEVRPRTGVRRARHPRHEVKELIEPALVAGDTEAVMPKGRNFH
jgi:DNA polymerase III alpha subunit